MRRKMKRKRRSRRRRKWRRNFEEEIMGYLSLLLSKIILRIIFKKNKYKLNKGGKQIYAMDLCSIWGQNLEKNYIYKWQNLKKCK